MNLLAVVSVFRGDSILAAPLDEGPYLPRKLSRSVSDSGAFVGPCSFTKKASRVVILEAFYGEGSLMVGSTFSVVWLESGTQSVFIGKLQ